VTVPATSKFRRTPIFLALRHFRAVLASLYKEIRRIAGKTSAVSGRILPVFCLIGAGFPAVAFQLKGRKKKAIYQNMHGFPGSGREV
jgi:hypothetical protein